MVCGKCHKFMPSLFVKFSFDQKFVGLEEALHLYGAS